MKRFLEKVLLVLIALAALLTAVIGFWLYKQRPQPPVAPEPDRPTVDNFFPVDTGDTGEGKDTAPPAIDDLINQNFGLLPSVSGQGLSRLLDFPIAGFQFTQGSSTASLFYLEKSTGHLYERNLLTGESTRLANYTAPGLAKVAFLTSATSTEAVAVQTEAGRQSLIKTATGEVVTSNLIGFAVAPNKDRLFVLERVGAGVLGSIFAWSKPQEKKVVFRSPLAEWQVTWPAESKILISTKPANGYAGFVYAVDPETGNLSRLIGNLPGLNVLLSPNGEKLLYTTFASNRSYSNLLDLASGETRVLSTVFLPEKCVWAANSLLLYCATPAQLPNQVLPDSYYRGEVAWNDNFWQINATSGEGYLIFQATSTFEEQPGLDVANLTLSQGGNRLLFENRLDSTLWSLSWE